MFSTNEDRREAVRKIILQLPRSFRPYLDDLFRSAEADPVRETELYSALRSTLNTLTVQGALPRRSFLQIAGLVVTGGLGPLLYPEKAHAWQAWTGFWQNIQTNSYVTPTNTGPDPYWDYVVLLMNFDGTNGSTVFADESNVGKAPTITGAPYIDTGAGSSPYSGKTGHARFNGTSDYVYFTHDSSLSFGTSDFTIEHWFYWTGSYVTLLEKASSSVNNLDTSQWMIDVTTTLVRFYYPGASIVSQSHSFSSNTWHHVAFVRSSGTIRIYIDGVSTGSATCSNNFNNTLDLYLAYCRQNAGYYALRVADLRIYNGVAKYTANFTPNTAPIGLGSANDSNWGYCVLACPFESTLKDMSGKRATATGSTLSTSIKKFGTASGSFSGSSQEISIPTDSSLDGYGDFTIEAWIYGTSWGSNVTIVSKVASSWSSTAFQFGVNNTGKLYFNVSSNGSSWDIVNSNGAGATTLSLNTWYHVAVTRKGSTVYSFVNGNLDATVAASSTQMVASSAPVYIGSAGPNGAYFYGYIDSLRITKGYARYTSSFTPPTVAYPIGKDETVDPFWSNTVLAMHMDDLTDATGRHALTANGSAAISSSQSRFGSKSLNTPGASSWVSTASQADFTFGSSDFTLEFWMYQSGTNSSPTSNYGLFTKSANNSYGPWAIEFNTSNQVTVYCSSNGSSWDIAINAVFGKINSSNTWHHIAFTRQGSTWRGFINGVLGTTFTSSAALWANTDDLQIGRNAYGEYFAGYIDDLRVTKAVARYIANFTPPTRAFVNGGVTKTLDTRTWIAGSSPASASAAATYGTQGTGSTSNTPGGRQGPVSWTDSSGNLWLFGGTGLDSASTNGPLNDLWKFNPTTLQWTWVSGPNTGSNSGTYGTQGTASTSNIPRARYASTSWIDSSGNLWLFGGLSYGAASLNDLWKFNPTTLEWTWVSGSSSAGQSGTYGTQGTASGSNIPGARYNPTSWIDSSGNFWIFGGYGNASSGSGRLNDLWKFNPTTLQWTWVAGASSTNQNGTYGSLGASSSSNVPGGRSGSVAWIDSSGNLWLFGGNGYDSAGTQSYLNDLWKFNPSSNQWTWMGGANTAGQSGTYGTMGTSSSSNIPGARANSVASIDLANNVYLFGGNGKDSAGSSGGLNDLWKLNLSNNQWTWIAGSSTKDQAGTYGTKGTGSTSNMPGARSQAALWIDSNGVLSLFSGSCAVDFAVNGNPLNDLWKFS